MALSLDAGKTSIALSFTKNGPDNEENDRTADEGSCSTLRNAMRCDATITRTCSHMVGGGRCWLATGLERVVKVGDEQFSILMHDSAELSYPGAGPLDDTQAAYCISQLRPCDAIIITYDSTNLESFEEARERWLPLSRKVARQRGGKCVLVLVGAKKDLADGQGQRLIDPDAAFEVARQFGAGSIEVSARFFNNINALFKYIGDEVQKRNPTKLTASRKCTIA